MDSPNELYMKLKNIEKINLQQNNVENFVYIFVYTGNKNKIISVCTVLYNYIKYQVFLFSMRFHWKFVFDPFCFYRFIAYKIEEKKKVKTTVKAQKNNKQTQYVAY